MADHPEAQKKLKKKVILEELSKIEAQDIMIPRSQVAVINQKATFPEIIQAVISDGHSRFPVYLDKIDNIVGILYVKDLLSYFQTGEKTFDITKILRKPLFVSENKKTSELLSEFREERVHIAIVVDEYGTMLGIISMEDVLEEIVGDISDEYDKEEHKTTITQQAAGLYTVLPRTTLEDFNACFKTRIMSDHYETIGGFIIDRFGYVPKPGESMPYGNYVLEITEVKGSRLQKITVRKA